MTAKSSRKLTATDYDVKLAKSEAYEQVLMDRLKRTLARLNKANRRSRYFRKKITELSE